LFLFSGIYCNHYEHQKQCNAIVDRFRLNQESSVGEGRIDFSAAQATSCFTLWLDHAEARRRLVQIRSFKDLCLNARALLFDRGTRCSQTGIPSLHRCGFRCGPSSTTRWPRFRCFRVVSMDGCQSDVDCPPLSTLRLHGWRLALMCHQLSICDVLTGCSSTFLQPQLGWDAVAHSRCFWQLPGRHLHEILAFHIKISVVFVSDFILRCRKDSSLFCTLISGVSLPFEIYKDPRISNSSLSGISPAATS
jgi:hypothetical protein